METLHTANDLLIEEPYLIRAETGKRFLNYMIDLVLFYLLMVGLGIVLALVSPATLDAYTETPDSYWTDRLLSIILYALYMGIVEAVFRGKSLGKLITGTRAVNMDGSRISVRTAFSRGLCRAVPFCVFSAFGSPCNPWQDKWTNTMVIDVKKSGRF